MVDAATGEQSRPGAARVPGRRAPARAAHDVRQPHAARHDVEKEPEI